MTEPPSSSRHPIPLTLNLLGLVGTRSTASPYLPKFGHPVERVPTRFRGAKREFVRGILSSGEGVGFHPIEPAWICEELDSNNTHMKKNIKIVVIGGSRLVGTKLVNNLRRRGYEVVAASPSSGVNTLTGEGLAEALNGAQVAVDVSNAPAWEDQAVLHFFETSGRNLLAAEAAARVKHHVALSVVGTERLLASGYFRAKMAQEIMIKSSKT